MDNLTQEQKNLLEYAIKETIDNWDTYEGRPMDTLTLKERNTLEYIIETLFILLDRFIILANILK